jgi:hypothetical protein
MSNLAWSAHGRHVKPAHSHLYQHPWLPLVSGLFRQSTISIFCACSGAANKYHVFISHAGQDKLDFVTFLFNELKARGVKCFLEYDEQDGLVPGTLVSFFGLAWGLCHMW